MHTEAGSTRHHLFCHPPASHERWKHALHLSEHVASQLLVSQQLWLQWQLEKTSLVTKSSAVQRKLSGQTFNDMFNLCCDLNLEHSTPIVSQDTWTYYDTPSALSGCERISSSENTGQVKFWYISPHHHFDLWDSKLIFWISIWLMMRPLHTKFGYKTVGSSEDIIWTRLRHTERWTQWFKIPNHI